MRFFVCIKFCNFGFLKNMNNRKKRSHIPQRNQVDPYYTHLHNHVVTFLKNNLQNYLKIICFKIWTFFLDWELGLFNVIVR